MALFLFSWGISFVALFVLVAAMRTNAPQWPPPGVDPLRTDLPLANTFDALLSRLAGKPAPGNPWEANTLEWTLPLPAPEHNYEVVPTVHHGPYEYGVRPDRDWLPQTESEGSSATAHP